MASTVYKNEVYVTRMNKQDQHSNCWQQ